MVRVRGSETQQLLHALDVGLLDLDHAGVAAVLLAAAGGRGGRERRAGLPAGLQPPDLAGRGHLEALAGTRVRLVLGHVLLLVRRTAVGTACAGLGEPAKGSGLRLRSPGPGSRSVRAPSSGPRGRRPGRWRAPLPPRPR